MSRAGLDALLADADALASRLAEWPGDPTGARDVVEGLAQAVRDLRDERDEALARVGELVLHARCNANGLGHPGETGPRGPCPLRPDDAPEEWPADLPPFPARSNVRP